ncbi:MAG TPA: hypothetical protein VFC07_00700 [Verrucomicrobiae bacterium]|nr:hypothetical protein [Verrucomicrobiae bacterium]
MRSLIYRCGVLTLFAAVFIAESRSGLAAVDPAALSADQIIQKAVERSELSATRAGHPDYRYTKRTVTEELDAKGRLKEHKEKLYEVLVESGLSYLKLLQVNGQILSTAESKKQEAKDGAERQKLTEGKLGQKGDDRENFLTADLVERYKFTLIGEKPLNGRNAYLLSFEPKRSDLPVRKMADRFLNQIAGTVWVDAEEFEVGRMEVHLNAEVALWGGIIGTLRQGNFTLERTRLQDGAWFTSFSHGLFEGRKLLEPMVVRTRSQSTNFRRISLAAK